MYRAFIQQISKLVKPKEMTLLAISGGVDSAVLAALFHRAQHSFAIAHANFGLRGEESDQDQAFVKTIAQQYSVPFFTKKLDAATYAAKRGISIQMAARELRYNWFASLLKEHNMQYIATAHHQMDELETFIRHIIKGTSIAGLRGMKKKQGNIIRPLLFATKQKMQSYALDQNITWREDSSNQKSDYERNYIRHHIIPHFMQLNPNLLSTFQRTKKRLNQMGYTFEAFSEQNKLLYWKKNEEYIHIAVTTLLKKSYAAILLHHWLTPFGFNYDPIEKWVDEPSHPGKKIVSNTHLLIAEAARWVLMSHTQEQKEKIYLVNIQQKEVRLPTMTITIKKEPFTTSLSLHQPPHVALLDHDLLTFPLTLRPWQQGDYFHPFGMNGHQQKVSDLLTNRKCPPSQKKHVYVLTSDNHIVWVVGYRISHHFQITLQTKTIYSLSC